MYPSAGWRSWRSSAAWSSCRAATPRRRKAGADPGRRYPLWAAAYLVNGGCSDDGFEYFRGWLIMQGREVYERVVADPDALADLAAIRAKAPGHWPVECEDTLHIAAQAYRAAAGGELPALASGIEYPELDPEWDFSFDDDAEMAGRLPRLATLFLDC